MKLFLFLLTLPFLLCGCSSQEEGSSIDQNVSVPNKDPSFPSLGSYWVIDKTNTVANKTIYSADAICQKLQDDGVAEVVVVVINGVKHPQDWTTHYGRWLKLGKKGRSTQGGNNGIVWLIRPDATEKLFISVGRGLPKFTSTDYRRIMGKAINYINFGNLDQGIKSLVQETDRELRSKYSKGAKK
ncbi:MAG: TPM domain-containing protein [Patescibacteria group bacterium]